MSSPATRCPREARATQNSCPSPFAAPVTSAIRSAPDGGLTVASLWHAGPADKGDVPFTGTLRQTFYKYVCVLLNIIVDNLGG
jgi:hypothetical protein